MGTPNQSAQDTANLSASTSTNSKDIPSSSTNSLFSTIDGNDRFRPFYSAPVEHDANVATIVLVKRTEPPPQTMPEIDYFNDLAKKIPIPGSNAQSLHSGEIPQLDRVNNGTNGYYGIFKNFSLIQYQETRSEIARVNLNFGLKWNAYFFGSQPRIYVFSGIFLDAKNYPYYEAFMKAYDNYLSGGKCVAEGFRMYIAYDNKITAGWMLGIDISSSSDQRFSKAFSFKILIDDENWFRTNYEYNIDGTIANPNSRQLTNLYQLK